MPASHPLQSRFCRDLTCPVGSRRQPRYVTLHCSVSAVSSPSMTAVLLHVYWNGLEKTLSRCTEQLYAGNIVNNHSWCEQGATMESIVTRMVKLAAVTVYVFLWRRLFVPCGCIPCCSSQLDHCSYHGVLIVGHCLHNTILVTAQISLFNWEL